MLAIQPLFSFNPGIEQRQKAAERGSPVQVKEPLIQLRKYPYGQTYP